MMYQITRFFLTKKEAAILQERKVKERRELIRQNNLRTIRKILRERAQKERELKEEEENRKKVEKIFSNLIFYIGYDRDVNTWGDSYKNPYIRLWRENYMEKLEKENKNMNTE